MAAKYLAKPLRRDRPKYVEDWVDQATSKALGVDENDLWMCAQAKERGLVLVTTDQRMKRIEDADSDVRLLII
jgi:predicted nucleic acid-binding protein